MKLQNLIRILMGTVCIGLLPGIQAVVPAPDGGYPNLNTAEGQNPLQSLTSGAANTALGAYSLFSTTTASFNTAVGAATLFANTGNYNTAIGTTALFSNTTGPDNTATGNQALFSNTAGEGNTANGVSALSSNTTGNFNTANGRAALLFHTTGSNNTATGYQALFSHSAGDDNTAIGYEALFTNTTGSGNTALGVLAGLNVTTANNVICIGADGNNVDNSCYIGNIFNATSSGGTAVFVNANGRLGTGTSSKRFKEAIKPMDDASETLFLLKPVTFRYKKEVDPEGPEGKSHFGLVAEDVEKVNPDLVVRDKEGKPYSVRYDQVNAMLLNEFLKARRQIDAQQKQIEALTAGLQKVSAQMEANKPVSRTVMN